MSKEDYKGLIGQCDGSEVLYKCTQDHSGWLILEDKDGHSLENKVRKGDFTPLDEQPEWDEGGEMFVDEETGNIVDAEGNEIDTDEEEGDEAEEAEEDDKAGKPMYALQRRKAEGAYETIKLDDGRTSLVSKDHRQTELDTFAGDPEGAMGYVEGIVGLAVGTLAKRYEGRNPGQKRMNAGNILRSFRLKEGMLVTVSDEVSMDLESVKGVWARLGKNPTEKKLRALIAADIAEVAKREAEIAAGPENDDTELKDAAEEADRAEGMAEEVIGAGSGEEATA